MGTRRQLLCTFLFALVCSTAAHANGIVNGIANGYFSNGLDGLAGWTTADTDSSYSETVPSASVSVVGTDQVAQLDTQGIASDILMVSLYQGITVPGNAATLSFDIGFAQLGSDSGGTSFLPDFFQVSYVDDTSSTFDRYFVAVDINGFYDPTTFDPVTLTDLGNGLFHSSTSIPDLAGRSGTLYFDLNDFQDGYYSRGLVDNVRIDLAAAPEPGTLLLLVPGLMAAGAARGGRRAS